MLMMKLLLVPVPCYDGCDLFGDWLKLPAVEKLRSFAGTMKRVVLRGWIRPLKPATGGVKLQDSNSSERSLISPIKFES